jgi:hypothetical protein
VKFQIYLLCVIEIYPVPFILEGASMNEDLKESESKEVMKAIKRHIFKLFTAF